MQSDEADMPSAVRPSTLDLSLSDEALRPACTSALSSLTPMLALVNHGCEASLRNLAEAMRSTIATHGTDEAMQRRSGADGVAESGTSVPLQQAHELEGHVAPAADALRACLRRVCLRVLSIALDDPALGATLAARRLDVQGRLCLRAYPSVAGNGAEAAPAPPSQRLGAHCDSTLMTLLWADAPGLEVLDPVKAADWTPDAVMRYGLPMMGEVSEPACLREDQWARVHLDWSADPLLLTVGTSWLRHELMQSAPARCAVLHRVVLPDGTHARHSLPFLADLVPAAEAAGQSEEASSPPP